jgi:uncharacterized protein (DUF1697 family)
MTATARVALLRGINVGTAKRMAMADLRALLASLGYDKGRTLLNSGNAIFLASGTDAEVGERLEAAIKAEMGMQVGVVVRSAGDVVRIVADNPFVGEGIEARQLAVAFLGTEPGGAAWKRLEPDGYLPDRWAAGERVVYLVQPNGVTGTKLPNLDRLLGVTVTARNWNTTTKLAALAET